jgi:2-phosphosulfolactate phosphatase
MEVRTELGQAGARRARGTVVVIDVFRAFTVSAYALARGARECVLVREVDEARRLAVQIPGAVISAEVDGRPVAGVRVSNSPTMISELDLADRVLIQRTSAGTQGAAAAAEKADRVLAAGLVVLTATARCILRAAPDVVTLVATGEPEGHLEDRECADLIRQLLEGRSPDVEGAISRIRDGERYAELSSGAIPGFPASDLDLALQVDRFDFAMEVAHRGHLLVLSRASA